MRSIRGAAALAVAVCTLASIAAAAHTGPTVTWKQITHAHNGVAPNLGLARAKDGTLHVFWAGPTRAPYSTIFDTPVSPAGNVGRPQAVISGWNSVQPPAAATAPDGSIHVLISGQKVSSTADPLAGLNEAVGPGSWKLGPRAFGHSQLTVASAAQVATAALRSGQLVSAWRSANSLLFQSGVDPATQPVDITPPGLADDTVIAVDQVNGDAYVAYEHVASRQAFYRRVLPSLAAPQRLSQGKLPGPQLAARAGGGVYSAYAPGGSRVALVRLGGAARAVPVPKGVEVLTAGLAAGPEGRLWVFYGNAQQTFVTRTSKAVGAFEPVQAFHSPPGGVQYFRLEGEGSAGPLDLFADVTIDGASKDGSYGTHVLPMLSLAVAEKAMKNAKGKSTGFRVTVRVLDAGDPVAGATVAGLPGGSKTTDVHGSIAVTIGKRGARTITASKAGYVSTKGRA